MKKSLIVFAVVALVLGYAAYAVLVLVRNANPTELDFVSSPLDSRDIFEFKEGSLGILEPGDQDIPEGRPATQVYSVPKYIEGDSDSYLLDWGEEEKVQSRELADPWVSGLQGDDKIELVAFASWVPEADDDFEDPNFRATPDFYDAKTLAKLSNTDLDQQGIPKEFRSLMAPKRYPTPKIRLIFKTSGMKYVSFPNVEGSDKRTEAVVTYNLDSLGEKEKGYQSIGGWTRLDAALLIWHDTPIKFYIQVLTGEPIERTLNQALGEQVVFDDYLRVQWLKQYHGDNSKNQVDYFEPSKGVSDEVLKPYYPKGNLRDSGEFLVGHEFATHQGVDLADPETSTFFRVNSRDYLEYVGWVKSEDEVLWDWKWESSEDFVDFRSLPHHADLKKPMKLVMVPNITELTFELPGLPGAPNPRSTTNLFDVKIPRLTLDEDWEEAEDNLIGILSVAAELEWDLDNIWDSEPPKNFPKDRTFRNQSPQDLLNWYIRSTSGASVEYVEAERKLYFNEETVSWFDRFLTWAQDKLSGLFP